MSDIRVGDLRKTHSYKFNLFPYEKQINNPKIKIKRNALFSLLLIFRIVPASDHNQEMQT